MATLLQFGAGKVGRSFIGQLFAAAGYSVIFADVYEPVVRALNELGEYRVAIKRNGRDDEILTVRGVRAIDGKNLDAVAGAVAAADYLATSVGLGALPGIFPALAAGLRQRASRPNHRPLDIIIAENIRDGARYFANSLLPLLPPGFPLANEVGLVETSIGKMIPLMRGEEVAADPLLLFAEEYSELIVDRRAFRGPLPQIPTLHPVENIKAYVDRKLFIHNLGHAATAYLGFRESPRTIFIWQALESPQVLADARSAMRESAAALALEYPLDLSLGALDSHIEDLLGRFANRALGDTLYRVGRDLYRKLARDDRLVGAALLAARHNLPFDHIAGAIRASVRFRATDDSGDLYPSDAAFAGTETPKGLAGVLRDVCGLRESDPTDREVMARILR